jgi:hypothetical protein
MLAMGIKMALDAFVYCDCYEKNNLRCDPPARVKVKVEPTGDLMCLSGDEEAWSAFLAWKRTKACLHHGMIFLRHRLGTSTQIDLLQRELRKEPDRFPILLRNVLYSGTHTCDWIPLDRMEALSEEIKRLPPQQADPAVADALQLFKVQMAELIIAAKHTRKPICF